MSSFEQPSQKRPRRDCNNNDSAQNCNTPTNTNINLLSLPDEALNNIISYSMPRKECQIWEWIGILSYTCRSLRRFAKTYAPTRIVLKDFRRYPRLNSGSYGSVDVRVEFLRSLRDYSWKRQHLKEFHVNPESVLRIPVEERFERRHCSTIKALLRTLITTPSSFPELEWLDIELQSDYTYGYDLVDAESLQHMPDAFPSLHKLSLSECFKHGITEISPHQLRQFCTNLNASLTSLSMCSSNWMTDAHVEAMMPIIGENLMRLELVCCSAYDDESNDDVTLLSDNSLISIAQYCNQLESFSMVESDITCRGLEMVLSANTGITTLNLSCNKRLDSRTVDIISRYLPRVEVLRNYWLDAATDWLSDDGLIALIDAQERESSGSGIFLKLIGLWQYSLSEPQLTIRGLKYAIEKGVEEMEINECELFESIEALGSGVKLYQAHYIHYIDGSLYKREVVHF